MTASALSLGAKTGLSPRLGLRRAWFWFLGYVLFVVVFGAVVRITGSGAGCGQHWPTCHGEIAHLPRSLETTIELTHRVTSGLTVVLILALLKRTFSLTPKGHPARRFALLSFAFLIVESLVGAALVLFALVGQNSSLARAAVMAVHLINTSFLVSSIELAGWSLGDEGARRLAGAPAFSGAGIRRFLGALLLLAVSAAGAVTALGDTLYPVAASGAPGVLMDAADAGAHFLERIRGFHPILAVVTGSYLLYLLAEGAASRLRIALVGLVLLQLCLGVWNVWLGAPGWMQVVHLSVGTCLWLAWSHYTALGLWADAGDLGGP